MRLTRLTYLVFSVLAALSLIAIRRPLAAHAQTFLLLSQALSQSPVKPVHWVTTAPIQTQLRLESQHGPIVADRDLQRLDSAKGDSITWQTLDELFRLYGFVHATLSYLGRPMSPLEGKLTPGNSQRSGMSLARAQRSLFGSYGGLGPGVPNTQIEAHHRISEGTFHRNRREAVVILARELAEQEEQQARS